MVISYRNIDGLMCIYFILYRSIVSKIIIKTKGRIEEIVRGNVVPGSGA